MAVVNSCHEKINVPFDRDNWIVYIKLERSTSMKILGKRFNQQLLNLNCENPVQSLWC